MSDRGMKKWAPFSSLIEQATCLEKMQFEKNKIDKPHISSEVATKINQILTNYHNEEVEIKFFYNGYIYNIKTTIKTINKQRKEIILDNGKIPFSEIIDIVDKDYLNNFDNYIS